jgi:hypothetical protein
MGSPVAERFGSGWSAPRKLPSTVARYEHRRSTLPPIGSDEFLFTGDERRRDEGTRDSLIILLKRTYGLICTHTGELHAMLPSASPWVPIVGSESFAASRLASLSSVCPFFPVGKILADSALQPCQIRGREQPDRVQQPGFCRLPQSGHDGKAGFLSADGDLDAEGPNFPRLRGKRNEDHRIEPGVEGTVREDHRGRTLPISGG